MPRRRAGIDTVLIDCLLILQAAVSSLQPAVAKVDATSQFSSPAMICAAASCRLPSAACDHPSSGRLTPLFNRAILQRIRKKGIFYALE